MIDKKGPKGLFKKPEPHRKYMKIIQKFIDYLKQSKIELKKVIWPDRKTTTNHTLMVIAFSLGVAFFLGVIDRIFTYLFQWFIRLK